MKTQDLPTGTVTFLFTDIEGSTRLLDELGDRYAEVLDEHRSVIRKAIANHGGVEVGTEGDSFFVAFTSAPDAVAAASEAQDGLHDGPARVRMGLHTGEPILTAQGYVGMDIHRAARISGVAHGGQVIFSERTRSQLGAEFKVTDLGLHRLKDLGEPARLFQLGSDRFPPLRSLNATNLPAQPNRLVGRNRELAEVAELINSGARLVTLTGPGGTGKTRLALQVAAELVNEFKDGVFWVPLAAVRDPQLVISSIEQTVGAKVHLAEHVDEKRMLLLLDNLEQVLDVGPRLAELLSRCPNLHLLVTSRALLRLSAEHEYLVPVLPSDDAVALFRQRAAQSEPEETVREICRRLDGLPLAVELAAARTRLLSAQQLLGRLNERLPLLTGGPRDAPDRQRTLRATIEWSYDLLTEEERETFERVSVFAGSFTPEAADAVCGADLDMLQGLIEHSLLRCWASGRLGMLETIHEFALKKLEEHGNLQSLRRRHAEWLLSTLESANLCVEAIQSELPNRYDIASPEVENARAALQWALESGEIQVGLKLATSLEQFWVSSLPFEGARWFEELLSVAPDLPLDLRARALRAFGGSVYIVGEFERGRSLYDESLALYRSLGDERGVGHLIFRIAYDEFRRGNHTKARELVRESLDIHERLGVRADESQSLTLLAELAELDGDYAGALVLYEQSAERARDSGFIWWLQGALLSTAELALRIGDPARACSALREVLELVNTTGDRQHTVYGLAIAAALAAGRQDPYHCGVFWGFLTTEESRGKVGQWESSADRDHVAALVHAQAGPELQHGMQEGSLMTRDEILLRAIAWLDEPSGKMAE